LNLRRGQTCKRRESLFGKRYREMAKIEVNLRTCLMKAVRKKALPTGGGAILKIIGREDIKENYPASKLLVLTKAEKEPRSASQVNAIFPEIYPLTREHARRKRLAEGFGGGGK